MPSPDPRTHAFRSDLADVSLQHTVTASRYAEPVLRQCIRGVLPLFAAPDENSRLVSQIRYGEFLDVFEMREDGFAWVQNRADRYVGYMPAADAFNEQIADLSNRVNVLKTFVYTKPDLKMPPADVLTLGSFVRVGAIENGFCRLASGGYVFAKHVVPAERALAADYVFTAGRLLNVPYLWGGRTPQGIDCSGLVQLVLEMAEIECPRDSDQQREVFGQPLSMHWRDMDWRRGDLVFFDGHVGIMTNNKDMIHATAHVMQVTVEPLFDVVMRGAEITAMGRPAPD
ncbi:MAG TPA: NlpC/P60 family protein [Alphaproteobacteria bacterium]|nr:NlpC/P60 family protein [Alphaproteobacteria bacterium]